MSCYFKRFAFWLFAIAAIAYSGEKTLLFNRAQFQPHQVTGATSPYLLTVPIVYGGSLKMEAVSYGADLEPCVDESKTTLSIWMTICQPCIDCFPCTYIESEASDEPLPMASYGKDAQPGIITKWNFYLVKEDKKSKVATIHKIDLIDTDSTLFFTGSSGNKGLAVVQGETTPAFFMTSKKSDYTFSYTEAELVEDGAGGFTWELTNGGKKKGYVKSLVSSVRAKYSYVGMGVNLTADYSLKRDASLTKAAFNAVFGAEVKKPSKVTDWENCTFEQPADFCEAYFSQEWDPDTDGFDGYLFDKYAGKKWEVIVNDSSLDEAAFDLVYDGKI